MKLVECMCNWHSSKFNNPTVCMQLLYKWNISLMEAAQNVTQHPNLRHPLHIWNSNLWLKGGKVKIKVYQEFSDCFNPAAMNRSLILSSCKSNRCVVKPREPNLDLSRISFQQQLCFQHGPERVRTRSVGQQNRVRPGCSRICGRAGKCVAISLPVLQKWRRWIKNSVASAKGPSSWWQLWSSSIIIISIPSGAFLIPYGLIAMLYGIPMFLLETSVGQFTQEGFVTCWRKLCPLAQGERIRQDIFCLLTFKILLNVFCVVFKESVTDIWWWNFTIFRTF